jgi:hypothetical protein
MASESVYDEASSLDMFVQAPQRQWRCTFWSQPTARLACRCSRCLNQQETQNLAFVLRLLLSAHWPVCQGIRKVCGLVVLFSLLWEAYNSYSTASEGKLVVSHRRFQKHTTALQGTTTHTTTSIVWATLWAFVRQGANHFCGHSAQHVSASSLQTLFCAYREAETSFTLPSTVVLQQALSMKFSEPQNSLRKNGRGRSDDLLKLCIYNFAH